ncbi:hypothetical protein SG34_012285 [Thalassomonas viridans]|uniref:Uncharacterized protein n=1 Tax=Thalassomonas viridans TaxID=137584 RepID=A0AAF0CC23_9GAMM|nr:hypothetical protein [Thalassomonas viridans]WDE07590.1 hypothetical protein SG34_012285 [Thalassomonas viridans]
MLILAAALTLFIGIVHSYLGERYLLSRLFKRDNLPQLLGSDWFTKRVLRFAWHLTTVAWFGFAAIFVALSGSAELKQGVVLTIISVVFLMSGLVSFSFTKGKHISWVIFWAIAALAYYVANS